MKKLFLAFFLSASLQWIHADDVLKNSDFTDGALSWHGDGRAPADLKPQDSLDTAPDYGDKGLVIQLKPRDWTKVIQEFRTNNSSLTLNITYKLAPNTTFSTTHADYVGVPHSIGFDAWMPFNGKEGCWMTMVSDFTKSRLFYDTIAPKLDTSEQTSTATIDSLIPEDEKTLCLTFPPGTGAVILLHVSMDTK